jgi:hypothetical protein
MEGTSENVNKIKIPWRKIKGNSNGVILFVI